MKVVVATRNRGKLVEIARLLGGSPSFELVTIDEIAPEVELREDEETFQGNAVAKARQAAIATGLPAIADDSGLEVDALNGAPGVWSARYAGEPSDDARNNAKLLEALRGVPDEQRKARFRCAAAFVDRARAIEMVECGECEGNILEAPRGTGGFGYDPLFLATGLTQTMAELPVDKKNQVSHRAAAFRALAATMKTHSLI